MQLEPGEGFNVLSGDNGQGKTNLLEAIYAVCTLRSFRTSRLADLVALGHSGGKVAARLGLGGLERVYELELRSGTRTARIDGKAIRPLARYFGQFNVVLFAPEDLQVVRGSPADRRRFWDRAVFNTRPEYLPLSQEVDKLLRSRNRLLRDVQTEATSRHKALPLLDVYDQQLSAAGARLMDARASFLAALRPRLSAAFDAIVHADLPADVTYDARDELREALSTEPAGRLAALAEVLARLLTGRRDLDLRRGTTSVGPHRDDLLFTLAGQPAASFASQGQTRAMVLAWKTALLRLLVEVRGEPPVLLLDDVSSELDPTRNEYLFAFLAELRAQSFITTTDPRFVLLDRDRRDFRVAGGRITPT